MRPLAAHGKQLSSILVVGWYPELMSTRTAMLRSEGYGVKEMHDLQEALQILNTTDVALVIVCSSIPRKLRRDLVSDMKHAKPFTPVLVFGHGIREADTSMPALAGPEMFLRCVASLVNQARRQL
jgi:DNA-binding response OmpR family regulator